MACHNNHNHFNVDKDVPDLSGKVCFVTGGNTGLGKQTVLDLAKHNPSHIYFTARSPEKGKEAIDDIRATVPNAQITCLKVDFNSLASVRDAAQAFLTSIQQLDIDPKLDILILNAGIMCFPPGLTSDGYEIQFGTNHMAHALLTKLLLPTMLRAPKPRLVVLASDLQSDAPAEGIQLDSVKTTQEHINTRVRYGQSKLANILFVKAMGKRYPQIVSAATHPGIFKTNLQTSMKENNALINGLAKVVGPLLLGDASQGTRNQLWAATHAEVKSGEYYVPVGKVGKCKFTGDHRLADRLWDWTENELKGYELSLTA
jgi:retinol dehydrogenase 12